MKSEEDKQRIEEAKTCDNCIGWHKHCKAECCKIIFLNIDKQKLKDGGRLLTIKLPRELTPSEQRYYHLREVEYLRKRLRFKRKRIVVYGDKIMYVFKCKLLSGNLCIGHPDKKPELCRSLTLETSKMENKSFQLTKNCLFKYK